MNTEKMEQEKDKLIPRFRDDVVVQDEDFLPVIISDVPAMNLKKGVVLPEYVNSFNFSKLSNRFNSLNLSLGVTSANRCEGKTITATNMAVSLARGYKRSTLLIDMNFRNPDLHNVFGVDKEPGLAEALELKSIKILPTSIENLYLLPAGNSTLYKPGIEHTMVLRDVFSSLKREFDFVIVDMSAVHPVKDFPIHFINEIDGLISVIDSGRTKKAEFNNIFRHIDEKRFVGYVFNRSEI